MEHSLIWPPDIANSHRGSNANFMQIPTDGLCLCWPKAKSLWVLVHVWFCLSKCLIHPRWTKEAKWPQEIGGGRSQQPMAISTFHRWIIIQELPRPPNPTAKHTKLKPVNKRQAGFTCKLLHIYQSQDPAVWDGANSYIMRRVASVFTPETPAVQSLYMNMPICPGWYYHFKAKLNPPESGQSFEQTSPWRWRVGGKWLFLMQSTNWPTVWIQASRSDELICLPSSQQPQRDEIHKQRQFQLGTRRTLHMVFF